MYNIGDSLKDEKHLTHLHKFWTDIQPNTMGKLLWKGKMIIQQNLKKWSSNFGAELLPRSELAALPTLWGIVFIDTLCCIETNLFLV